jgi:hypothetical protein
MLERSTSPFSAKTQHAIFPPRRIAVLLLSVLVGLSLNSVADTVSHGWAIIPPDYRPAYLWIYSVLIAPVYFLYPALETRPKGSLLHNL